MRNLDPMVESLMEPILRICECQPDGITDGEIVKQLKTDAKVTARRDAYNELLKSGRLVLGAKQVGSGAKIRNVHVYKWQSAKDAEKFRGLDASERMVYDIIEKAAQNGVTKRDMKYRTNIQNGSELKQIVERLMTRGMVKEIKSVQGANKKVYIAAEFEPSTLHTGGAWYNEDQEFDTEFIEAIYEHVLKYIQDSQYVTVEQVASYVTELQISNQELAQSDIKQLMMTMLYDSVIEECDGAGDGAKYYRTVLATPTVNHLSSIPCGACPVYHDCTPGGVISPQTCVYMTEWLEAAADW